MWLFAAIALVQAQAPQLPDWMAGCWEDTAGARVTAECWSTPDRGAMDGESITTVHGKISEREKMRIALADSGGRAIPWMTFEASPSSGHPSRFEWIFSDLPGVTFINQQHDYPQRIRYWREGAFLLAEIAMVDGTRARRWRFSARGR